GRACILFLSGADEGSILDTGNVVDRGSVIVAARELFLVELDHFAGLAGFLSEGLELLLGAVDPNDLIRVDERFHFVNPREDCLVVCHSYFSFRRKGKCIANDLFCAYFTTFRMGNQLPIYEFAPSISIY